MKCCKCGISKVLNIHTYFNEICMIVSTAPKFLRTTRRLTPVRPVDRWFIVLFLIGGTFHQGALSASSQHKKHQISPRETNPNFWAGRLKRRDRVSPLKNTLRYVTCVQLQFSSHEIGSLPYSVLHQVLNNCNFKLKSTYKKADSIGIAQNS